jgi:hypothetical protein
VAHDLPTRWHTLDDARAIVSALEKGTWRGTYGTASCPAHDDEEPSLSVTARDGRILVHCHLPQCDQTTVISALRARGLWPCRGSGGNLRPKRVPRPPDSNRFRAIWSEAKPLVRGSIAWTYWVEARCCCLFEGIDIREHPSLWYEGRWLPGLIAAVRNIRGELIAISRTFLSPSGEKIKRKALGPILGGHVVIHGPDQHTIPGHLVVGEGLESAASAAAEYPEFEAWAALSANGMQALALPANLHRVVIFPDMDDNEGGQLAAAILATRAKKHGVAVEAISPDYPQNDINDEHQASCMEAET